MRQSAKRRIEQEFLRELEAAGLDPPKELVDGYMAAIATIEMALEKLRCEGRIAYRRGRKVPSPAWESLIDGIALALRIRRQVGLDRRERKIVYSAPTWPTLRQ